MEDIMKNFSINLLFPLFLLGTVFTFNGMQPDLKEEKKSEENKKYSILAGGKTMVISADQYTLLTQNLPMDNKKDAIDLSKYSWEDVSAALPIIEFLAENKSNNGLNNALNALNLLKDEQKKAAIINIAKELNFKNLDQRVKPITQEAVAKAAAQHEAIQEKNVMEPRPGFLSR